VNVLAVIACDQSIKEFHLRFHCKLSPTTACNTTNYTMLLSCCPAAWLYDRPMTERVCCLSLLYCWGNAHANICIYLHYACIEWRVYSLHTHWGRP